MSSKSKALKKGKSGFLGKFSVSQMETHGGFPKKYINKARKYESKHSPKYLSGTEIEKLARR